MFFALPFPAFLSRGCVVLGAFAFFVHGGGAQSVEPFHDKTVELDALQVNDKGLEDEYDPTGMDGPELEHAEPPFSNDLVMAETSDDTAVDDVGTELQAAVAISPAESAAGVSRVNLKGFPTPRQRNGFTQVGVSEILNTASMESIQGPLTPVLGRAAPGGIQNFTTARPRGRAHTKLEASVSSHGLRAGAVETSNVLVPRRSWYRVAVAGTTREGPEPFSFNRGQAISGALVWKINRAWSTMLQLDYDRRQANAAPGVIEYRPTATAKIVRPYYPLIYFNAYGPNAGFEKRTASASFQAEGLIGKRVSVRAGVQALRRDFSEDRWTQGQYLLDTARFGGVREPQQVEQPFRALAAQVDATTRFFAFRADHKFTASLESSFTRYERVQRALSLADRNSQPLTIRSFDPAMPNYDRPDYSPELFSRFITNRRELSDYTGIFLSERAAFMKGRLVVTVGLREDFVAIDVADRRSNAPQPQISDTVSEFSHHAGANYVVVKGRILAFANTSTAFEPSTRVDARTGRVQGNETTLGYEAGAKAFFFKQRLALIGMGFTYFNQNISRRNPLYEDPILDANQTQAQLASGAEERFTGGTLEGKFRVSPRWTLSGRATYNHAITTKSPDLPEEIGRELSRFPSITWTLNDRYSFDDKGPFGGLWVIAGVSYIGSYVANYETLNHEFLQYSGYPLVNLAANYRWKVGPVKKHFDHSVSLNVRNVLDRDLARLLGRPSAGREVAMSYVLNF